MSDTEYIRLFAQPIKSVSVWERVKDWVVRLLDHMNSNGIVRE